MARPPFESLPLSLPLLLLLLLLLLPLSLPLLLLLSLEPEPLLVPLLVPLLDDDEESLSLSLLLLLLLSLSLLPLLEEEEEDEEDDELECRRLRCFLPPASAPPSPLPPLPLPAPLGCSPGTLSRMSGGSSEASRKRGRERGFLSCCVRVGRLWYTAVPVHSYVQWPCCRQRWQVGEGPCWPDPKELCREGRRAAGRAVAAVAEAAVAGSVCLWRGGRAAIATRVRRGAACRAPQAAWRQDGGVHGPTRLSSLPQCPTTTPLNTPDWKQCPRLTVCL